MGTSFQAIINLPIIFPFTSSTSILSKLHFLKFHAVPIELIVIARPLEFLKLQSAKSIFELNIKWKNHNV